MSDTLDYNKIEELKSRLMVYDTTRLEAMYKVFRQQNSSSGSQSKGIREMGMAYISALRAKRNNDRASLEALLDQQQVRS